MRRRCLLQSASTLGLTTLAGCSFLDDKAAESVVDLSWSPLPGPPGGPVTYISLCHADPDGIYAASRTAGIFASTDGGANWLQGFSGMHHRPRIWASRYDPKTAFTKREWTDNAGQKWHHPDWSDADRYAPVASPIATKTGAFESRVYHMEWDPFDEAMIYAATPEGLFRTSDGGRKWVNRSIGNLELPPDHRGWDFTVHPEREGLLTVGIGSNIATSTDRGDSWSHVNLSSEYSQIRDRYIRGVQYIGSPANHVYLAIEGEGVFTWVDGSLDEITSDLPDLVFTKHNLPLSVSADREKLYFIAGQSSEMYPMSEWWDSRKLYVYEAGTDDLSPVDTPEKPSAVATHPTDPSTLFVGGEAWIHKSTDGGQEWTALSTGFVDHYLSTVAVNPTQPSTVFPGSICSSGLSVSHDQGQSYDWKRSGLGPWHRGEFSEHYIMHISAAGSHAYATTAAGLLISDDNGETWSLLDNRFSGRGEGGGPNTHLHGLAVDRKRPEIVYVGTGRGGGAGGHDVFDGAKIWKSTDGGETWREITTGFPTKVDTTIQDIVINPHNPDTVYVATNAVDYLGTSRGSNRGQGIGLFKSTDAGENWTDVQTPFQNIHSLSVDAESEESLYASAPTPWNRGASGAAYRSVDGGESWDRMLPYETIALSAHPSMPGVIFAGSMKYDDYWEVLVSEDGGDSWAEGNLRIRASADPSGPNKEYDAAEIHSEYWGNSSGQIMWFAIDDANSLLYGATNGVGLWQADTSVLMSDKTEE